MASIFRPFSVICIIIILAGAVNSILTEEFDSMLDTLRVRGYDLFCNAIVTSDLQFELLLYQNDTGNNHSFTFFAPMDSSLFAIDMTQTASTYTDTLRFHVVPRRLSISDLLLLPEGSSLPTILPHRYLNVTRSPGFRSIAVGGVDIAVPNLFYGRDVAVHGLAGILSLRSNTATGVVSGSPMPAFSPVGSSGHRSFPPRTDPNSLENRPVLAPSAHPVVSPITTSLNVTSHAGSPPPVEKIPPVNRTSPHAPAPEPATARGHSAAGSPDNRAVHAPEPVPGSLVNRTVHAPELKPRAVDHSHSPAGFPVIHGFSPASPIESPSNSYVLTPMLSHAFTPPSESPEYRHSSISAPPLAYSDTAVPAAQGPDMWLPKKHRVTLLETFTGGSEEVIETVGFGDEVPEKSEPLDGIANCVAPDVGLGLLHSTRDRVQFMQCRY